MTGGYGNATWFFQFRCSYVYEEGVEEGLEKTRRQSNIIFKQNKAKRY